jgi:hypothetical protein
METSKKKSYKPKTTGQISWAAKKDKKRAQKWEDKRTDNYEKTEYCLDSPKFTEYYSVSDSLRVLDLIQGYHDTIRVRPL